MIFWKAQASEHSSSTAIMWKIVIESSLTQYLHLALLSQKTLDCGEASGGSLWNLMSPFMLALNKYTYIFKTSLVAVSTLWTKAEILVISPCWRVIQTARQQLACKFFSMYTQTSGDDAVRESRDRTRWFTHLPGLPERGCWVQYILWSGWFSHSAKCHRWGWGQRSPTETPHHPVLRSPQKWHLRACADSYLGLSGVYKETVANCWFAYRGQLTCSAHLAHRSIILQTFIHLANAFIQSHLKCIQGTFLFYQCVCSLGSSTWPWHF